MSERKRKPKLGEVDLAPVVEAAQDASTPTEREKEIVDLWERWQAAIKYHAEVKARAREEVNGALAGLRSAVEQGVQVGDDAGLRAKLRAVESAWAALDEARAKAIEDKKHSTDTVGEARVRLERAITVSQLSLSFGG